uniref:hypothetical protein n=1 Tax=Sphingomonas sp. GlSt437 TaxID=3389970 RepID=UPI003A84367C
MKLFGWKAAGSNGSRPALSRYASWPGVALGDWPQSYEAQARDGYQRNPVAQRAVRLVAEGVASAPLTASDPALAALVTARSGGQALTEALATHLLLHGNAYIQLLTDGDGALVELFALRSHRWAARAGACPTCGAAGAAPTGRSARSARATASCSSTQSRCSQPTSRCLRSGARRSSWRPALATQSRHGSRRR